jgi:hypothetical protein
MNGYTTVTQPSNEFRNGDIEPETSVGGVDAHDHPSYVWRGSADTWLSPGRPGYGASCRSASWLAERSK